MGEEPTKQELLWCLLSEIDALSYEYWYDDEWSVKEQIKIRSAQGWILQDMYDFANDSMFDYACDILAEYYNRVNRFYSESVSDEAKQLFASAMNESTNMYEYLLTLKEDEIFGE